MTAPEPVAAADAEADALLLADVLAAGVELEEELEEELQPAAASPKKASPTTAKRARVDR